MGVPQGFRRAGAQPGGRSHPLRSRNAKHSKTISEHLLRGLTQRYPMRQGAAVRMRDERGRETDVDPGQVAAFALSGWSIIE